MYVAQIVKRCMLILELDLSSLKGIYPVDCLEQEKILLDFCLTVHHQLGKVIQMNQLDATMIY